MLEQSMIERRWERQDRSNFLLRREIIQTNLWIIGMSIAAFAIPMPSLTDSIICSLSVFGALAYTGIVTWILSK